jgi:thiol-disulfide isomerase/thioredoxin
MKVFAVVGVVVSVLAGSASAQSFAAFAARPSTELVVPAFRDAEVTWLLETLDRLLVTESGPSAWRDQASDALWHFARRIQAGRLSAAQEARVLTHLDRIGGASPEAAAAVRGPRRMISGFTVGKTPPEIRGTDLDGRPFKLGDYRNKVVVLVFSAEWCAICRTQEPYERFLMERYERWPLALLGVQAGASREAARRDHAARPVSHRSWWDEPGKGEESGPIAAAWNVVGWPATYILDGSGVIRFIDLRDEDLLKGVRQLVEEQVDRDARVPRVR